MKTKDVELTSFVKQHECSEASLIVPNFTIYVYSSSYKQLFLDLNLFYFLSVSIYWHPFLPWGCNLNRKKKGNQQELWQKQSYSNYTEVVKSGTILNRMFKNARTTVLHRRLTSRGGGKGG